MVFEAAQLVFSTIGVWFVSDRALRWLQRVWFVRTTRARASDDPIERVAGEGADDDAR